MAQGKHQLSSDQEIQWEDPTYPNTWVETADERSKLTDTVMYCIYLKSVLVFHQFHQTKLKLAHFPLEPAWEFCIISLHTSDSMGWYYLSQHNLLSPPALPGNCDIERALRVDCGHRSISGDACYKLGCCYDAHDLTCYYRLNGEIAICLI